MNAFTEFCNEIMDKIEEAYRVIQGMPAGTIYYTHTIVNVFFTYGYLRSCHGTEVVNIPTLSNISIPNLVHSFNISPYI
jgi:hypothetical protein